MPKLEPYPFKVSQVNEPFGKVNVVTVVENEDVTVVSDIAVVPLYRDILYD